MAPSLLTCRRCRCRCRRRPWTFPPLVVALPVLHVGWTNEQCVALPRRLRLAPAAQLKEEATHNRCSGAFWLRWLLTVHEPPGRATIKTRKAPQCCVKAFIRYEQFLVVVRATRGRHWPAWLDVSMRRRINASSPDPTYMHLPARPSIPSNRVMNDSWGMSAVCLIGRRSSRATVIITRPDDA